MSAFVTCDISANCVSLKMLNALFIAVINDFTVQFLAIICVIETDKAMQSLELKLQCKPEFSKTLSDLTVPQGSSAQLSCLITG